MKQIYIILIALLSTFGVFAQTIVPNFKLVDTQGNQYDLYEELAAGKTIVLDFFALQCGTCQTGIAYMEDVWQTYGATGSEVWVWGVESLGGANPDIEDFIIANGGSYPGFNLSENDTLSSFFNITYTPIYFVICPDGSIKSAAVDRVIDYVEACQNTIGITENINTIKDEIVSVRIGSEIFVDYNLEKGSTVIFEIYDLLGNKKSQKVRTSSEGTSTISFPTWDMSSGYYFVRMNVNNRFVGADRFILR